VLDVLAPDDIVLYGVATDVCDKAAVEGLLERRPHTRLFVVTDAVKGSTRMFPNNCSRIGETKGYDRED